MSTLGAGTATRTPDALARRRAKYLSGLVETGQKTGNVVLTLGADGDGRERP